MPDSHSQSRFVVLAMAVHRLFISSLALVVGVLVLGGPFGLAPALAALMTEMADWCEGSHSAYGVSGRFVRRATAFWRQSLPVGFVVLGVIGLGVAHVLIQTQIVSIMFVICGLWGLVFVHHAVLRMTLDHPIWPGSFGRLGREILMLAWWHLGAIVSWGMLLFLIAPIALVPALALGPGALAYVLMAVVLPVARRIFTN